MCACEGIHPMQGRITTGTEWLAPIMGAYHQNVLVVTVLVSRLQRTFWLGVIINIWL